MTLGWAVDGGRRLAGRPCEAGGETGYRLKALHIGLLVFLRVVVPEGFFTFKGHSEKAHSLEEGSG
jgi:hypothetical protein